MVTPFTCTAGLWAWREYSGPLLFSDSHLPSLPEFISAFLSNRLSQTFLTGEQGLRCKQALVI